jgi:hypothetical protein
VLQEREERKKGTAPATLAVPKMPFPQHNESWRRNLSGVFQVWSSCPKPTSPGLACGVAFPLASPPPCPSPCPSFNRPFTATAAFHLRLLSTTSIVGDLRSSASLRHSACWTNASSPHHVDSRHTTRRSAEHEYLCTSHHTRHKSSAISPLKRNLQPFQKHAPSTAVHRHLRYEMSSKHGVATRQSLVDRACDILPEKLLPSRMPADKRLELGSRVGAECPWRLAHAAPYHSCPSFAKFDMPPQVSPASPNPAVMSTVGSAGALGTIMSIYVGQQPAHMC